MVRGDTLRDITIRAYGHDDWAVLMAANRGRVRRAEVLEIGWQLDIPCPAPVTAAAPADPATPVTPAPSAKAPAPSAAVSVVPEAPAPAAPSPAEPGPAVPGPAVPGPVAAAPAAPAPAAPAPATPEPGPVGPGGLACGQVYSVRRGDTLRSISRRVYGDNDYALILNANRHVIRSPNLLEVGWQLMIPCRGGTVVAAAPATVITPVPETPVAETPVPETPVAEAPAPDPQPEPATGPAKRSAGATAAIGAGAAVPPPAPAGTAAAGSAGAGTASAGTASAGPAPSGAEPVPAPAGPAPSRTPGVLPAGAGAAAADAGIVAIKEGMATASLPPCDPSGCAEILPPYSHTLRFLTGGDYAPFAGENLPDGGMITELATRALAIADERRQFRVDFVNDWGSHLSVLMPTGVFDLGFPWFRPDCSRIDRLSEAMRMRCTEFDFSHPVYEVVIGYYFRAGDPLAASGSRADLAGRRVCRPEGLFSFDLEQDGLVEPAVTLVRPPRPDDCMRMLATGEVDVVSLPVPVGEAAVRQIMMGGRIVEAELMATIQTMHVVAHRTNPFGRPYLTLINRGLRAIQESGEWFEIVSRHLAYQRRIN